ncbi:MAG: hypothetical protein ACFFCW_17310 [Candidatus Hodarchaeota archaeon]
MQLSNSDTKRYFPVRDGLLTYMSTKGHLAKKRPGIALVHGLSTEPWPDAASIDSFVADNPFGLSTQDLALATSWKRSVSGNFFVVRYLKKNTIIISETAPYRTYGVVGHHSPLSAIFGPCIPDLFSLRLLPFEDKILCTLIAFLDEYPVEWPSDVRRRLERVYRRARASRTIITSLD